MNKKSQFIAVIATSLLFAGCSSSRVIQTSGPETKTIKVSEVVVAAKPDSVSEGVAASYNSYSMSGVIRQSLMNELKKKGKISDSGDLVEVSVTGFRMRPGVTVVWVGIMAGSDSFSATVSVKRGDKVLKTFDVSARNSDSFWSALAMFRVSANTRAERFSHTIARKIADKL